MSKLHQVRGDHLPESAFLLQLEVLACSWHELAMYCENAAKEQAAQMPIKASQVAELCALQLEHLLRIAAQNTAGLHDSR